jgi:steroid delta-isomerase-like uncharacterized protein
MPTEPEVTIRNKQAVRRFNHEVIEEGSASAFAELMADGFVNQTAAPGMPRGADGMHKMFSEILRPALPDMKVEIHDQIAEGDKVVTRKSITGTHLGSLLGIPATGRQVTISVIDIVRLRDGQYLEHWGSNNLPSVLAQLREG